ncbi:MAG: hypothetical protein JKY09_03790 [Crocinitomicaceae bacterium]|nr:hypothetical protein [Crocinitomicaceae bacterium]
MKQLFIHLFFGLLAHVSFGQKLNAEVSEDQLYIGQAITLTYSVKSESSDSIRFEPQVEAIQSRLLKGGTLSEDGIEFEIRDAFRDTFIFNKKKKEWVGQYVITAWDSGMYLLPGPDIIINDSTFTFKDIVVHCLFVDPIDGIDLYDIKENYADIPDRPFSFPEFLEKNWWWLLFILIALSGFIYFKRKEKTEPEEEEENPISLKQRALIAIEALEAEKLWEIDKLKKHFVELSYILRSYLTSRYNISLLEKTTYETKLLLTKKGLNEDTVETISRILSQSDMVKFAKSQPDLIAILRISTLAKQIIAETSPLEFDNVE